jgi:5'-deoxynucleotidase YfbR-like HD superfamily hydrolase
MADHKYKLEDSGFQYILSLLKLAKPTLGEEIKDAWLEYEEGKTAEARWVRDMDKFECLIQAHEYEQRTYGEKDFEEFQGLSSRIRSPEGNEWLALLQQERQAHFSKRRWRTPVIFVMGISH